MSELRRGVVAAQGGSPLAVSPVPRPQSAGEAEGEACEVTYIIMSVLVSYGLALALVLRFMAVAAPPCTCPVGFADWMAGVRCARHPGYETEIRR